MSAIDKLRKRRFYPVTIDGETVHIRAMKESERAEVFSFKDEEASFGYAIGCGLLNEDGLPTFTRADGEAAKEFGARVLREADLPTDTRTELSLAILKLTNGPPSEKTVKN